MGFSLKITSKGKNPLQWIKEVETRIYPELQNQIVLSAEATAEIMKRILDGSGYNLKRLSSSIDVDILNSTGGVSLGIGNIDKFPLGINGQTYWEAFNAGFKPGASGTYVPPGIFPDGAPDASKAGGKWLLGLFGGYTFFDKNTNKKPIAPLRFVEIAEQDLKSHIEKEILKFSGNLAKASK
jgi:hypothetical protein